MKFIGELDSRNKQQKIPLGGIILFALVWCLSAHELLPGAGIPVPAASLAGAAVAVFFARYYSRFRFSIVLSLLDAVVFLIFFLLLIIINFSFLQVPLIGDEELWASCAMKFTHIIDFLTKTAMFKESVWLTRTPVNELAWHFSLIFISICAALFLLIKKASSTLPSRIFYFLLFAVLFLFGLVSSLWYGPSPGQPRLGYGFMFISSSIFGLFPAAFKFPSVAASAFISWLTWRELSRTRGDFIIPVICGFCVCMIPPVLYSAQIAELSIYTYAGGMSAMYIVHASHRKKEPTLCILSGFCLGICSLARQNVIIFWPVLFLLYLLSPREKRSFLPVFLPALLVLPYLISVKLSSHAVGSMQGSSIFFQALESGIIWKSIIKVNGLPWVLFTAGGVLCLLFRRGHKMMLWYLAFFPAVYLFFSVNPFAWGNGRYQAEFAAPFIALTVFLLAANMKSSEKIIILCITVYLSFYSLHSIRTMLLDTDYDWWPRRRLSNTGYGPLRKTLEYLKQQESGGEFVMYGMGAHGGVPLYFAGFNWKESQKFSHLQAQFAKLQQHAKSAEEFFNFFSAHKIRYFLISYGDKRTRQHVYSSGRGFFYQYMSMYYDAHKNHPDLLYVHLETFHDALEGSIDVYGLKHSRYVPVKP